MGNEQKIKIKRELKSKGARKCKVCGGARGLIRKYELYVCRRCFREIAEELGFKKYG